MNARHLIPLIFLASVQAQAHPPVSDATAAAQAEPAAEAATADSRTCLQHTGSHLRRDAQRPCVNASGMVITREQIEQTGATNVADALRRATPLVR